MATPQEEIAPLLAAITSVPETCLLGVSGGIDSVAMLDVWVRAGRRPIVVHFNHGWRVESDEEAIQVKRLARGLGLRFCSGEATGGAAKSEAEARRQRFAFFAKAGRRFGVKDLVLAHHADDQVETCLLQLFRGSGGVVGMQSMSTNSQWGLTLHRPWLGIWQAQIRAYALERKLVWWEDISNQSEQFKRNKLRLQVIPFLVQLFGPHWKLHLLKTAEIAQAERDWMDGLASPEASGEFLVVRALQGQVKARQRRTVALWLKNMGVRDIGFEVIESCVRLLHQTSPARVNVAGGMWVRRTAGKIFLQRAGE